MATAPANYDARFIQEMLRRIDALEAQRQAPVTKLRLYASDDQRVVKDITVNDANVITAANGT